MGFIPLYPHRPAVAVYKLMPGPFSYSRGQVLGSSLAWVCPGGFGAVPPPAGGAHLCCADQDWGHQKSALNLEALDLSPLTSKAAAHLVWPWHVLPQPHPSKGTAQQ